MSKESISGVTALPIEIDDSLTTMAAPWHDIRSAKREGRA